MANEITMLSWDELVNFMQNAPVHELGNFFVGYSSGYDDWSSLVNPSEKD